MVPTKFPLGGCPLECLWVPIELHQDPIEFPLGSH